MNVKKLLVLITLAFCFWSVVPLAFANEAGGPGHSSDKNDSNPGTASDIREDFYKRMKNAKSFSPRKYGGEDVVVDEESKGPGIVKHNLTGPVQVWPVPVKEAISKVPTMRDQGIMRNPLITFGLPISDTQYQILHRYNQNIMLEQLFDPEKVIWVINAMGMIQTQSAANSAANLARNQASSAIEYAEKYLPNFTTQAGNRWNTVRDKLFVPMAILLLLPGAVLAQIKAIIAQGSPLFGDINPFDGIIRSIMAIFFIPATYLVVNYGIDVSNSMALTIRENYQRIFHSNMYKDAECAEKRAFGIRPKDANDNGIFRKSKPTGKGAGDLQAWAAVERNGLDIVGSDPCKSGGGGSVNDLADETTPVLMNISRVAINVANVGLAGTWNVMCAFQLAYLHYLFLMGPIVAALWVWPIDTFRKALGSWIEGVLIICFWALFWNTTILLMACFRNVCVTGTVIMTALNVLAIYSVQHAFNFLGLVQAAGREAAAAGQEAGAQAAGGAMAHGAKHGVGAQGAAMTQASGAGHVASQMEKATGIPGGGPGAAAAVKAAGFGPAGVDVGGGGGGGAPSGVASGSGGPAGHGGAGGASPFNAGASSPGTTTSQGAGPHVSPPPGTMQGGSSQLSAGGGHSTSGVPPAFGGGTPGATGAGGHGGAAGHGGQGGAAGHGGASTPGSTGGQGAQQPGVLGQSGSHSSSMNSQSNSSLSQGQAAGLNPPPGQGLSAGQTHADAGGSNISAQQANQLHSSPPSANLHQGSTNANLGLNVHEGSHSATSHNTFGSTLETSSSMNVAQPPSDIAGGFGGTPVPTDIASGGGFTNADIIASAPPMTDITPNFIADQPPQVVQEVQVQNVETQTVNTEIQSVNQEVVTQEVQTMLPPDVQTSVAQEVQQPFVQGEPQQQFVEQPPQYVASSDVPDYSTGIEHNRVNVESADQTYVSQDTVASNQTVSQNTVSGGAVTPGGLQTNVQATGPAGTSIDKGQQIASSFTTPPAAGAAGASSVLGRAMNLGTPAGQQAPRSAQFSGPTHYGGHSEDTEELAQGPPPAANLGEAGSLANADTGAAEGHEGFSKGSRPQDKQPPKPQLAREDADENESYT